MKANFHGIWSGLAESPILPLCSIKIGIVKMQYHCINYQHSFYEIKLDHAFKRKQYHIMLGTWEGPTRPQLL